VRAPYSLTRTIAGMVQANSKDRSLFGSRSVRPLARAAPPIRFVFPGNPLTSPPGIFCRNTNRS
jgi:hypothetical protein